jgi:hypothetical protein
MHLVGFCYKNISRCTVLWMSNCITCQNSVFVSLNSPVSRMRFYILSLRWRFSNCIYYASILRILWSILRVCLYSRLSSINNKVTVDLEIVWKDAEAATSTYYPVICLVGQRKTTTDLLLAYTRHSSADLHLELPACRSPQLSLP